MRIRRFTVGHSLNGWMLHLYDEALWTVLIERSYQALMTALGEPCCYQYKSGRRTWAGWLYDRLPDDLGDDDGWRGRYQVAQYALLNNWFTNVTWKHQHDFARIPISVAQASSVQPEFVARSEAEYGPSPEPATTFTLATNMQSTITTFSAGA